MKIFLPKNLNKNIKYIIFYKNRRNKDAWTIHS